ncbi:hypothetical protein DdX_15607 [Ditylenchus destructor]|uniref:Uncharacterized protein n=1 Tax=Ditylenchus destructor TaxID=166010 RepID=A0AAD4R0M0_9BILA|nr:hypothetical protein DdX_15607 [Ditylenchus destructor]
MSHRGIKRRRANSSSDEIQRIVREKVHIPDDTWLQALKFLSCTEWSQKRFACRQINGIAQRNISRLPKMMIMTENVAMYYLCTKPAAFAARFSGIPEVISPDRNMSAGWDRYQSPWLAERKRLTYHTPQTEGRRVYLPYYMTHVTQVTHVSRVNT